jgi:hypothetical protein
MPQVKKDGIDVSDEEIATAFKNTNFGTDKHRELLNASVLKKLVGYHCGHTITVIMKELRLIGKTGKVTKRGIALVRKEFAHAMQSGG